MRKGVERTRLKWGAVEWSGVEWSSGRTPIAIADVCTVIQRRTPSWTLLRVIYTYTQVSIICFLDRNE